jgi:hypothetical protein
VNDHGAGQPRSLDVRPPRPWSAHRLADTGVAPNFDVGGDGSIAVLMPSAPDASSQPAGHVTFIVNALSEIRRVAPAR